MYKEYEVFHNGNQLYCRRYGVGEPIVLIHGACVDCDFYHNAAESLSRRYSVTTYDRRGSGRSDIPKGGDYSVKTQAADAAAVIRDIGSPCYVVAHSAATTIGMELAASYPELVRMLMLHEVPVVECLAAGSPIIQTLETVRELIHAGKYTRALNRFMPLIGPADERKPVEVEDTSLYSKKNSYTFIRYEFENIFYYSPQYERLQSRQVITSVGERSLSTHYGEITVEFAKRIGAPLRYLPGGHNSPNELPYEFAGFISGTIALTI